MRIVSIYAGHDANVSFYNSKTQRYHVIELERLVKKRYFRLHVDNSGEQIESLLRQCKDIAINNWQFDGFDAVAIAADGGINDVSILSRVFETQNIYMVGKHHECHATSAFYQSPFYESIIFSFDGGGSDGFFNIYYGSRSNVQLIENVKSDFGGGYLLCASILKEISEKSRHQLSLAGKMMGLCAYGSPRESLLPHFRDFFFDRDYQKLSKLTGLSLLNSEDPWKNPMANAKFDKQEAYDLAATAQKAFEEAFISVFTEIVKKFPNYPVIITGGGGLNVLLNERIRNEFGVKVFVPPNPNDCGLSLGALFSMTRPQERVNVTYNGIPLLDKGSLGEIVERRGARKTTAAETARLLKEGKIIGFVYGDSEVGPRALGNRSIVCDPSILEMKDILNSKVKFREWYRPFAPFCKLEDAPRYFETRDYSNLEYMGFAPRVKDEYKNLLPSITHADGTSRLQTVTSDSHKKFYELLTEFSKISRHGVLLNTSFNIRGLPILTTIEDALYVLDNTELDYVVVEDYIFAKK